MTPKMTHCMVVLDLCITIFAHLLRYSAHWNKKIAPFYRQYSRHDFVKCIHIVIYIWLLYVTEISTDDTSALAHDDVIKCKHFPRHWPFCAGNSTVTAEFPSQRPVTRVFSLICAWTNGWVNNRDSGNLMRHRAYNNVIVMRSWYQIQDNPFSK